MERARVLVLAHIFGRLHLDGFLRHAQQRAGWILGMVADKPYPHFCERLDLREEDYFLLPDIAAAPEWERDEVEVGRVRDLIATCERATGVPVHRIILADERNTGRGYGREFYYWSATPESRAALRNNALPERYAMRWFKFAEQVLDDFRPDLVIIGGQISTPPFFALTLLAKSRGLPFTINRPSKLVSNRWFWTSDLEMLNSAGRKLCGQKITAGVEPGPMAYSHIAEFRNQPIEVAYIQRINEVVANRRLPVALRTTASLAAAKLRWWLRGGKGPRGKPIFSKTQETLRTYWLNARQRRFFKTFTDEELARMAYLYIALHKEPELALNFQAPLWHNQKNLIAWLSENLPCGYRLLVRDHRRNQGRRLTTFYRDLLGYPGVDLISPHDRQFKYIGNADLIIADNGTTGWEGLVFGKRVISLARNFYEPAALAEQVRDPSRLGEIILRRLSETETPDEAEWDRRLASLIEAELETTMPEDEASHAPSLRIVTSLLEQRSRVTADAGTIIASDPGRKSRSLAGT